MAAPTTALQAFRFDYLLYRAGFVLIWLWNVNLADSALSHGNGKMTTFMWILLVVSAGLSFSLLLRWEPLRKLGWTLPRHWIYWPVALVLGLALGCGYAYLVRYYDLPPSPITPSLAFRSSVLTSQPVIEELIFRCAILAGFQLLLQKIAVRGSLGDWVANGTTAILFALWHTPYTPLSLLDTTVCGLAFGYLRLRSGSVAVAAVSHSAVNAAIMFIMPLWVY
jgi:membrane protease YdiL (CAAX protease family)